MRSRVRAEIRIDQTLPRPRALSAREEDGRRVGVLSEPRRGRRPRGEPVGHGKSVTREGDGGSEIARERKSAKGGVGFAPSVHRAGRGEGGGENAAHGDVVEAAAAEPLEGAGGGRPAPRVEKTHGAAAGGPEQTELTAADAGHVRVHHGEHGARGDGGVHRRAAGLEHLDARLGRRGMGTCDHTVRRSRRRPARFHVRLLARAAPRVIKAGQV
jgi:hypothetical protein